MRSVAKAGSNAQKQAIVNFVVGNMDMPDDEKITLKRRMMNSRAFKADALKEMQNNRK